MNNNIKNGDRNNQIMFQHKATKNIELKQQIYSKQKSLYNEATENEEAAATHKSLLKTLKT